MPNLYFVAVIVCLFGYVAGNPYGEDKYYDRDVVRQVAGWLVQAVCSNDLALCNLNPRKRNSEIINSILGLPKNLNEAGRK